MIAPRWRRDHWCVTVKFSLFVAARFNFSIAIVPRYFFTLVPVPECVSGAAVSNGFCCLFLLLAVCLCVRCVSFCGRKVVQRVFLTLSNHDRRMEAQVDLDPGLMGRVHGVADNGGGNYRLRTFTPTTASTDADAFRNLRPWRNIFHFAKEVFCARRWVFAVLLRSLLEFEFVLRRQRLTRQYDDGFEGWQSYR